MCLICSSLVHNLLAAWRIIEAAVLPVIWPSHIPVLDPSEQEAMALSLLECPLVEAKPNQTAQFVDSERRKRMGYNNESKDKQKTNHKKQVSIN